MSILFKVPLEDHPRMCGEQMFSKEETASYKGSPPRVRGTAIEPQARGSWHRITPACAGNRFLSNPLHAFMWDHPRVCGEQRRPYRHFLQLGGSPPRVRGTVKEKIEQSGYKRITPACAGNSRRSRSTASTYWDHPRVCGEQVGLEVLGDKKIGSPPRVRGTVGTLPEVYAPRRITPACAGNR